MSTPPTLFMGVLFTFTYRAVMLCGWGGNCRPGGK